MYLVENLYNDHKEKLGLELCAGKKGLKREILVPEADRPGLSLAGYLRSYVENRVLIIGQVEIDYLLDVGPDVSSSRLKAILMPKTPAVIVSRYFQPPKVLCNLCEEQNIALFRVKMTTKELLKKITTLLEDALAPTLSCHGSMVEIFGVGVLIQGDSAVGKSEAALGLVERGHRLVSDDVVKFKRIEEKTLEGFGVDLSHNYMEVRGVGLINVANLYGVVCVLEKKSLDIVVKLEVWNDSRLYDRVEVEENTINLLGVEVPFHVLPVKAGRDVVLLLETLSLNHRLKEMGYHSTKEFNVKLLSAITQKSRKR